MDQDQSTRTPTPAVSELDEEQIFALRKAVDKLVSFGERVGVTPEEMIRLLDSGLSVRGLLDYLLSSTKRIA
jgi:hypothetical protein